MAGMRWLAGQLPDQQPADLAALPWRFENTPQVARACGWRFPGGERSVLAQKLLPAKPAIDVPLALAIVGLGILIVLAPSSVPGLTPPM